MLTKKGMEIQPKSRNGKKKKTTGKLGEFNSPNHSASRRERRILSPTTILSSPIEGVRFAPNYDYETVFNVCPSLKYAIFLRIDRGSDKKFSPFCYQREGGPDSRITRNGDVLRKAIDKPYFLRGWLAPSNKYDDVMYYLPSNIV